MRKTRKPIYSIERSADYQTCAVLKDGKVFMDNLTVFQAHSLLNALTAR
jgi:hypothetical protein